MSDTPPPPPPPATPQSSSQASVPPPPPPPPPPAPPAPRGLRFDVGVPPAGWTALTVLFGTLAAIGIVIFGTFPIAFFDPEIETTAGKDVAQLMVGVALIGAALIFATIDAKGKLREALRRLGYQGLAWRIIGLGALAWGAYLLCALVLSPLLSPEQEDVTKEIGSDGGTLGLIVAGFLIVVVAPLSEETFFRGFMFAGLRRSIPMWAAAVISAAVWGSLHLTGGNVGVAIQLAVFGVILAWVYEHTGSLYAPIFAHMLNNAIAFAYLVSN